jgi:hypothetical protein
MRSNMYQSGVKCAADAAQEELKYFFKIVAKGDGLLRFIIKKFKRKETQHDIDCI